jgi:hypothetical protein
VVQHVEGDLDGAELHLVIMVCPGFRDVVGLHPDGEQERGADEHAGQDALATFKPETLRQFDLFGGPVEITEGSGHVSSSERAVSTLSVTVSREAFWESQLINHQNMILKPAYSNKLNAKPMVIDR